MKKLTIIFLPFLFIGCHKTDHNSKKEYNKKANELILDVLKKSDCDCMLEVPSISFITFAKLEVSPEYAIRMEKFVIKKLNLGKKANLNRAIRLSDNFKVDETRITEEGVSIINDEELLYLRTQNGSGSTNKCNKGIIIIDKPIFNRTFTKAIIKFDFPYTHVSNYPMQFELKNGEWIFKN